VWVAGLGGLGVFVGPFFSLYVDEGRAGCDVFCCFGFFFWCLQRKT